jgi:two-component system, OmpR family, phosphate regulon response regulator PhoB
MPMGDARLGAILVIDDDPVAAKLLELTLNPKGYSVEIARDMASGRHALESGGHDALILDIFLPDGSGWEILRYLRTELRLTLPVIVLTGHRQEDYATRAAEFGANCYVTKPFSPRELAAHIDRLTG